MTKYVPHDPTPPQAAFLLLPHREAMYGGAAGGGKSDALLMGALQYVDVRGYKALLLRRTYSELAMPGALLARAEEWLRGTDADWAEREHTWHFPSGASLTFGHLQYDDDRFRYQSSEFQYIGFDELTTFTEAQYTFLFSRLRRLAVTEIPLRMRAGSNPGGPGHDWVKARFLPKFDEHTGELVRPRDEHTGEQRIFLPALLQENPYLDREEYAKSLMNLDPVTRERLLSGDWEAAESRGMFRREWARLTDSIPAPDVHFVRIVRYWDLASTPETGTNDPDWTAGALMGRHRNGTYYLMDMRRTRASALDVENLITETARLDGRRIPIYIEQEPGAAGKAMVEYYARRLAGWRVVGVRPKAPEGTTSGKPGRILSGKTARAAPLASQMEAGNVYVVNGPWVRAFYEELEAFPLGGHDDQVDAAAGAFEQVIPEHAATSTSALPPSERVVVKRGDLRLVGRKYVDKK